MDNRERALNILFDTGDLLAIVYHDRAHGNLISMAKCPMEPCKKWREARAAIEGKRRELVASSQCPICGVDTPHAHTDADIVKWLNAQGSTFGVSVVDARMRMKERFEDLAREIAKPIIEHYWNGLVKFQTDKLTGEYIASSGERERIQARKQYEKIRELIFPVLAERVLEAAPRDKGTEDFNDGYSEGYQNGRIDAEAGVPWNGVAAAPLPTAREDASKMLRELSCYVDKLYMNLKGQYLFNPENFLKAGVEQLLGEWDSLAKRCYEVEESLIAPQPVSEGRLREALKPFAEFGQYLLDHPRKGISEEMYSWDNAMFIRKSDLIRAAELERALESA